MIACGENSAVTVRLWDLEGYPLGGYSVSFQATNWVFADTQTAQTTKVTDEDGYATAAVSPTSGHTITVAVSHDALQEQAAVQVDREALRIWSSPRLDDPGGEVTVYAKLTLRGAPVQGATIAFAADAGGSVDPSQDQTNSEGIAQTTFYANWSADPKMTASYTNGCGWQTTRSLGTQVDVVFVLDYSGSMIGHEASYPAGASVQSLVTDVVSAVSNCRFGAVMFNTACTQRSLTAFTGANAVSDFCTWVSAFSGAGGTTAQVEALNKAAEDLEENSPEDAVRYVVYVTDDFIGTSNEEVLLALVQRLDAVTGGTGGGVFVSLWEDPEEQRPLYHHYSNLTESGAPPYVSLAVNGLFDSVNFSDVSPAPEPRYPFGGIRGRVLPEE